MAKKKARRRNKRFTIPIGLVAPLAAVGLDAYKDASQFSGGFYAPRFVDRLMYGMTGYSYLANDWKLWRLQYGLLPIGVGFMAHKLASKIGINRALASAGVPWIRI